MGETGFLPEDFARKLPSGLATIRGSEGPAVDDAATPATSPAALAAPALTMRLDARTLCPAPLSNEFVRRARRCDTVAWLGELHIDTRKLSSPTAATIHPRAPHGSRSVQTGRSEQPSEEGAAGGADVAKRRIWIRDGVSSWVGRRGRVAARREDTADGLVLPALSFGGIERGLAVKQLVAHATESPHVNARAILDLG